MSGAKNKNNRVLCVNALFFGPVFFRLYYS